MLQRFSGQDVREAYVRIADFVRRTPLEDSIYLNDEEHRYRFKLESQQLGKSFKIRGALNVLAQLPRDQIERGVGTISTGNHGIAVSYACKLLGIENCVVVVPFDTTKNKLDRIRFYGARVMQMGYNYDEALTLGLNYIDRHELFYVDPGDRDPRVYAGQGTVGYEIMAVHPKVDTIVVPMGSGGLITGVAVAAKAVNPDVRIVGVQTAACPAVAMSLADFVHYRHYPVLGDTVCDAVVGGCGTLAFEMLPDLIDQIIIVEEKAILDAMCFMAIEEQCVIEGGSAMAVAAVREYPDLVGGHDIAIVITGGNVDGQVLHAALDAQLRSAE